MATAVPLHILALKEKGGPDKTDFDSLQNTAKLLAEKGDILLYGDSKKKNTCAEVFNSTVKAIAILSFVPGGITVFGQSYISEERNDII